jgi:drug/metabolite transporter (DMT)-like permease
VQKPSFLPYVWMLLGSFSFAVMATLSHDLGGGVCDWRVTALARGGLALFFAAVAARAVGVKLVLLRAQRTLWIRSLAGSISLACTFYAQSLLPPPELLTITNTFPIWVALLSWPLLQERPGWSVWLCIPTGILGVMLLQTHRLEGGALAATLAVVASMSTAVAMLGLHRLQYLHPLAIVVHFSAVATALVAVLIACDPNGVDWQPVLLPAVALRLLAIGITATIGQWFLTKAFAGGPPAKVSLVALTQIVFAFAIESVIEPGELPPARLLGIALVMAPTAWVMAGRGHE